MGLGFDFSLSGFLLGTFFGLIGTAYFMYGKKQTEFSYIISGLLLCIFPWFVTDSLYIFIIGAVITASPYFLKDYI